MYAKDITPDDKQELDESLQREIQAAFRTDEIRRTPPTPQDEMRAGMSYFHETIWNGVPKFLRRVDTALKNIGIDERVPYNAPLIQFSSWMGGDRDGTKLFFFSHYLQAKLSVVCFLLFSNLTEFQVIRGSHLRSLETCACWLE